MGRGRKRSEKRMFKGQNERVLDICKFYARGRCIFGHDCLFSHRVERPHQTLPHLKLCPAVERSGSHATCQVPGCRYAHSLAEVMQNFADEATLLSRGVGVDPMPAQVKHCSEDRDTIGFSVNDLTSDADMSRWSRMTTLEAPVMGWLPLQGALPSSEHGEDQCTQFMRRGIDAPLQATMHNTFLNLELRALSPEPMQRSKSSPPFLRQPSRYPFLFGIDLTELPGPIAV